MDKKSNSAPKKPDSQDEQPKLEQFPDISNVASAGETTGMMPTPPQTEAELEALQELAGMEYPKKRRAPIEN